MDPSPFQGTGSRPIRPNNITNLYESTTTTYYSSPQRISDLLSSSVNSSPCSFLSATSTADNTNSHSNSKENHNNIADELELVSCSFTAASRVHNSGSSSNTGSNSSLSERTNEGMSTYSRSMNQQQYHTWNYPHFRHKLGGQDLLQSGQGQSQGPEHGHDLGLGQRQQRQRNKASASTFSEDHHHDLYCRPGPDHTQQQELQQQEEQQHKQPNTGRGHPPLHYRHCSLNHDDSCPKQGRRTTPIHPLRPTSCLSCQPVPSPPQTTPPEAAESSTLTPKITTITSGQQDSSSSSLQSSTSLPVMCMCSTTQFTSSSSSSSSSSLPARKYRTISTTVASLDLAAVLLDDGPLAVADSSSPSSSASEGPNFPSIITATTITTTSAATDNTFTTTFVERAAASSSNKEDDSDPNTSTNWTTTLSPSPSMSLNNSKHTSVTMTKPTAPVFLSSASSPSADATAPNSVPKTSSSPQLTACSRDFFAAGESSGSGSAQLVDNNIPSSSSFLANDVEELSLSRGPCNLLPGFHSMHQHQFFHHLALQQQQQQQSYRYQYDNSNNINSTEAAESSSSGVFHSGLNDSFVDDSPSPMSSAPGSPARINTSHSIHRINHQQAHIMSSSPEGSPSSSSSSSEFHSPCNSITWASPSRTQTHHRNPSTSPMTTVSQQFASLAEFNRNRKGKGIARGFYRSSKEERRRLQQEKQKLQPWRATMDGLPREIKIHIFRYLSTFQLVRVSRVSRSWRSIAMDGSLWKVIDTTRFYKIIKDDQLRVLGTAASGFLRYANFRGCAQLSGESLRAIAEHCPNVERLDLAGCRSVSSKSIADVCMNMPLLLHLDLSGLQSVNNYTLQAMAVYCRSLQVLNLAWCKQISGLGLSNLTRSCQDLRKLNIAGCGGLEDRWMPVMGMNLPKLREICLNGCVSLTDRGLIGLLSGLAVAGSRKHRRWRMKKRMAPSVKVSSLGHLIVSQSSSCNEGDGEDEDEEDEEERERRAAEELDEEYEYGEDDSDKESEVDGDDEDDENGNLVKNSSSSNAATTTTSSGRSGEEGLQARLDYLGLSHCRLLTTEALRAIGHYCNRHLRRLELSGCEDLTDEGLILLAQNCTRLRLLDLEEVSLLTDASLRAFGMHLSKLERLSLSYCENVTDQGIIRMLRPAPNPTTLSTANNTIMANPDSASQCCRRLVYLELDNCLLITDRLLLEFANVLEERKAVAIEKMKEKEKKREERRERIRQKKRKSSLLLLRSASSSGSGSGSGSVSVPNLKEQQQQRQSSFEGVDIYLDNSGNISANNNEVDDASTTTTALGNSSGSGSFVASRPVNIPTRLRLSNPSLAASGSGSVISSYTSSPLQPRSVLASTLVSDEIVVKKTRPGLRIMVPTRSASTTSTTSTTSITSSSSLALWPSALQSRRRRLAAQAAAAAAASGKDGKYTRPRPVKRRRLVRPTLQIFDCRNITLEGVEAAQLRCPSLAIKSYYSWSNPSTSVPAASTLGFGGSGGSLEEAFEGELEGDEDEDEDADDEDVHGTGIGHGSGRRSGSSGAGGVGGVLTGGVGGSASSGSANSSQTSLHHLHVQQQHLQQLQLQRLNRPANLLQRARLGLLGGGGRGGGHGHQDSQCTIL